MEKEIQDIISQDSDILKINLNLLLKTFDQLDEKTRQTEFNKMAMSLSIIKQIIKSVRELGIDKFKEILNKDEFISDTFRRIGIWNECGVDLGYTKRIQNETSKN